jgi:hypothetical protein
MWIGRTKSINWTSPPRGRKPQASHVKRTWSERETTSTQTQDGHLNRTSNDNFTKIDVIQNASKLFKVLRSVSKASDLLSPSVAF